MHQCRQRHRGGSRSSSKCSGSGAGNSRSAVGNSSRSMQGTNVVTSRTLSNCVQISAQSLAGSSSRSKDRGSGAGSSSIRFENSSYENGDVGESSCLSVTNTATHGNRHTNSHPVHQLVICTRRETGALARLVHKCLHRGGEHVRALNEIPILPLDSTHMA